MNMEIVNTSSRRMALQPEYCQIWFLFEIHLPFPLFKNCVAEINGESLDKATPLRFCRDETR